MAHRVTNPAIRCGRSKKGKERVRRGGRAKGPQAYPTIRLGLLAGPTKNGEATCTLQPGLSNSRISKPIALVTAGPTRAYLDRVRYLTNHSTGALGFLICKELLRRNFAVVAVVGSTALKFESLGLTKLVRVETHREMLAAVKRISRERTPDIAVFCAAVLDFEPKTIQKGKLSSGIKSWKLELVPTVKIVREFARLYPTTARIEFKLESDQSKRSLRALGKRLIYEHGCLAVCVNYLEAISEKRHPATIFANDGKVYLRDSKTEIAQTIARLSLLHVQRILKGSTTVDPRTA